MVYISPPNLIYLLVKRKKKKTKSHFLGLNNYYLFQREALLLLALELDATRSLYFVIQISWLSFILFQNNIPKKNLTHPIFGDLRNPCWYVPVSWHHACRGFTNDQKKLHLLFYLFQHETFQIFITCVITID